jgi:hypothetical protein
MNNIRLDNPCPVLLSRMKGVDGGHFCQSCSKVIVDYTKLSVEEIRETMKPGACGIFTSGQVTTAPQNHFRHFLFYSLALLSFLGFNVKPLKAQTTQRTVAADTLQVNTEQTTSTSEEKKSWRKKTRKSEARKAKRTKSTVKSPPRLMGCPVF